MSSQQTLCEDGYRPIVDAQISQLGSKKRFFI